MLRYARLLGTANLILLAGCASFVSTPIANKNQTLAAADGIYYYMPTAPIFVQVALDDKKNKTITTPAVSAVPDRSKPYLLTVPDNYIGENHATLSVNASGLLESAATVETSGADTLVKAVATDLGTLSALAGHVPVPAAPAALPAQPPCHKSTTYTLVVHPELAPTAENRSICGLNVSIEKLGGHSPLAPSSRASDYGKQQAGIFYKTQIPYLLTVTAAGASSGQSFIVYSPDEAPVQFMPLKRSVFANNTTTFTLSDGILTKSESDVGGELTGFVALPAAAIGAYMSALGNIFTAFKTNSSNASAAALSNAQWQLCKAALAANPLQGVSPAQAATNYAAIKSACSG
jgi:hypothetical protein